MLTKIDYNSIKSFEQGIHLYINILNLERLISNDEKDDDMNHVFSLLNTFVYSIEDYIISNYPADVAFEKLTGGRIHLIINDVCARKYGGERSGDIALDICSYARALASSITSFRQQYASISRVDLQFGADFGPYVDYDFYDSKTNYQEYTSIGSVANFACKLQCIANSNELLVSQCVADRISWPDGYLLKTIDKERQNVLSKYGQNKGVYSTQVFPKHQDVSQFIDKARAFSNEHPLKDMVQMKSRVLDFDNWSVGNTGSFTGVVVFADVRGFTRKFTPNGSNLEQLAEETRTILFSMYSECAIAGGLHVQFQGDREFSVFTEYQVDDAIVFALKLLRDIKENTKEEIGIGCSFGKLFASTVGRKNSYRNIDKQNVVIGTTVNVANRLEDRCAMKNEIAISIKMFSEIKSDRLKQLFSKRDDYYVAKNDYSDFYANETTCIREENHLTDYRKPWCK